MPILTFNAIYNGQIARIAAYTEEAAKERAIELLGGIYEIYQTHPLKEQPCPQPNI
jgi:hypothetical protein